MVKRTFAADVGKMNEVQDFVSECIKTDGADEMTVMQIALAVEEVFVNIASYSYPDSEGDAEVTVERLADPSAIRITFADSGIPFDPLNAPPPDVNLPAEERPIGGLGIFLVRELMDDVSYRYENGKNILAFEKRLDT